METQAVSVGEDDSMIITWTLEEDFDPTDSYITLTLPKANILYMEILDKYRESTTVEEYEFACIAGADPEKYC